MAITKAIYLQEETWKRLEQIQRRCERTISISNLIEIMVIEWLTNCDQKLKYKKIRKEQSMTKQYQERIAKLRKEMIQDLETFKKSVEVSIRTDDPYDPEQPSICIYEVNKDGILAEEYEERISFNDLSVELLLCILEEIERRQIT